MWLMRRNFLRTHSSAVLIQAVIRGFITRQKFICFKEQKAALRIQVLPLIHIQSKKVVRTYFQLLELVNQYFFIYIFGK